MRIIGGTFKNRQLYSSKTQATRPTSGKLREAIFNIVQHQIEGAFFLDLFSGFGAMGFEALSRGAAHVVFVEKSKECCRMIERTGANFACRDRMEIYCQDTFLALKELDKKENRFTLIFADPPYEQGFGKKILTEIDNRPRLMQDGRLLLEEGSAFQPQEVLKNLSLVKVRKYGKTNVWEFV